MSIPLRMLLVLDFDNEASELVRQLRRGGYAPSWERVATRVEMEEALQRQPWDIVLADYGLLAFSAPGALAVLREKDLDVPFIIVSGTIGEFRAISAIKSGARDFVQRSNLPRLVSVIGRELREAEARRERQEAETRLRRDELELSEFFESAGIGLQCMGPDGSILTANRAELEILGYSREDYVGRRISEFYAEPDVAEELLRRLLQGEQVRDYEARLRRGDGSIKHVLIDAKGLWENGRLVNARCFTRDVTGRKEAELAERRAELLSLATALASTTAHEINNPLTVVMTHLEMFTQRPDIDGSMRDRLTSALEAARQVHRTVMRMGRLVRVEFADPGAGRAGLLDFNKSSGGS